MKMGHDKNGWELRTPVGRPLLVVRPPAFEDNPPLETAPTTRLCQNGTGAGY